MKKDRVQKAWLRILDLNNINFGRTKSERTTKVFMQAGLTLRNIGSSSLFIFCSGWHSAVVLLFIFSSFVFQIGSSPGWHYAECPACINTEPLCATFKQNFVQKMKVKIRSLIVLVSLIVTSCSSYDKFSQKEKKNTKKERHTKILFIAQYITQEQDTGILFIFRENNFFEQLESHKYFKQKYFYGNYSQTANKIDLVYRSDIYISKIKYLNWNATKDTLIYFDSLTYQKMMFPKKVANWLRGLSQ